MLVLALQALCYSGPMLHGARLFAQAMQRICFGGRWGACSVRAAKQRLSAAAYARMLAIAVAQGAVAADAGLQRDRCSWMNANTGLIYANECVFGASETQRQTK